MTIRTIGRSVVVTLAAVALGAGVLVSSVAPAAPPSCGKKNCTAEIDAGSAGLSGKARSACSKSVIDNCKAGGCTCTMQPGLPDCTPTSTTTTSTSTSTSSTTVTTTSTSSTSTTSTSTTSTTSTTAATTSTTSTT